MASPLAGTDGKAIAAGPDIELYLDLVFASSRIRPRRKDSFWSGINVFSFQTVRPDSTIIAGGKS